MFCVRSSWVRITAAMAVGGAGCLAVTACGGTSTSGTIASSSTAAPSASATVDPLAGLPASKVVAEANADAEAAPTLTLDGNVTQQGQNMTIDLGIKRGQGCTASVSEGSQGSFKLILIGNVVYLDPDAQFWKANAGANAAAVIALVNGRYLKAPASDKNVAGIADICDVSKLLDPGGQTFTRGTLSTLDGRRILAIKVSDGSTDYVTDTSKPEYVEATSPKGAKDGSGAATVSVGAPVTLAAPPASQVIDGTKLGL